jgi:Zn-dependent protease with chaperone function
MEISGIHLINNDKKSATTIRFDAQTLFFENKNYLYSNLRFEVGGNNNSLLFIHVSDGSLVYVNLDRATKKQLLQIETIQSQLRPLFKVSERTLHLDLSYIGLFLVFIAAMVYFRGPIAGSLSKLIPVAVEKKLGDKIFKSKDGDEFKKVINAEQKMRELLKKLNSYDEKKFTVHISSKKDMNAYATIGGHLFINRGLIEQLEKPEDLLGVIGHEMIHVEKRHVIQSIFQGAGLFLLIQTFLGDVMGVAAVLADNASSILQLSYSRELEKEADLLAVRILLDSQINPAGLASALKIIEAENSKAIKEMAGGETMNKILNQNFLRSHPQTEQRCLDIQNEIDLLLKTSKYEQVKYLNLEKEWAEFKAAMSEL